MGTPSLLTLHSADLWPSSPACPISHQTSQKSSFTQKTVCSLATADGRITLSAFRLLATRDGIRNERELAGDAEWRDVLREHFGVTLPF